METRFIDIYETGGKVEPGDLYYIICRTNLEDRCLFGWENCPGRHLHANLPNGHGWCVDSRASNCGRPEDNIHRCWVRHGDPEKGETVHVDKNGNTCQAGAGSILVGDYHGFLHNGRFTNA